MEHSIQSEKSLANHTQPVRVVLDTNIFVAAGFNPQSASHKIIAHLRTGHCRMIWIEATWREIRRIVSKIPPLSWHDFEDLFREDDRFAGPLDTLSFAYVQDPADRKFAALATAAGAVLISQDEHLLAHRGRADVRIVRPEEFLRDFF